MTQIDEFKKEFSIPVGCASLEELEDKKLAPWATKYSEIKYKNDDVPPEETYRTRFRRDKDRILYSKAFRRLQYKTQVIGTDTGDDFRTRLTHSLEVEQIATSLADALKLNKDLVSAIALGHDLGHTPYGHAVEALLNEKLHAFSHAIQSVRYLENQAKDRKGLNISIQVLEGILKHDTDIYGGAYKTIYKNQHDCTHLRPHLPGSMESQVVYWADKIAYLSHDFEDFNKTKILDNAIKANKISKEDLERILSTLITDTSERNTRDIIRNVINHLINGTIENLSENRPTSSEDVINITNNRMFEQQKKGVPNKKAYQNSLLVNFSETYRKAYLELKGILNEHYLGSPEIRRSDNTAKRIVGLIVEQFRADQKLLPLRIQAYIDSDTDSKERAIADYLASMTDRQARSMYHKLFEVGDYNQYE